MGLQWDVRASFGIVLAAIVLAWAILYVRVRRMETAA
jgi:hypothetical protein